MGLAEQWSTLEAQLPPAWAEAELVLRLAHPDPGHQAATLLAPLQPLQTDERSIALRVSRRGEGPGTAALRSGLERLDARRIGGALSLRGSEERVQAVEAPAEVALAAAWRLELERLPGDWSDLLAEIELDSSDYLERAAVNLAPINPRRVGARTTLRFRSARSFGYGAAPGVVAACLERCDQERIRGRIRLTRVLCDTQPVGTQGPVWQIDGETV